MARKPEFGCKIATFGLSEEAAGVIRSDWSHRLHGIFPEQTSGTCA
jgi:hypothetical protein